MSDLRPGDLRELGSDTGRGNLLGVQPLMRAGDYASAEALSQRLAGYLDAAAQRGWLGPRTIVVWPEHVGTWLAAAGEGAAVARAGSLTGAMLRIALRHARPFVAGALRAREADRAAASLFRLRAAEMARAYQAVFGGLARRYAVTVVAGSIVLPEPAAPGGQIVPGDGPLYGVSAVFNPDGRAQAGLVRKVVPTAAEQPFTAAAPVADLPSFDTPAGRLGVLICADAWYPEPYARLKAQGIELLAVASSKTVAGLWDKPWAGYDGASMPPDVDAADIGRLTEGQACRKYALAGRIASSGARAGVDAFLRGELWDIHADSGQTLGVRDGQVVEASSAGAAIVNVWV